MVTKSVTNESGVLPAEVATRSDALDYFVPGSSKYIERVAFWLACGQCDRRDQGARMRQSVMLSVREAFEDQSTVNPSMPLTNRSDVDGAMINKRGETRVSANHHHQSRRFWITGKSAPELDIVSSVFWTRYQVGLWIREASWDSEALCTG